MAEGKAQTSKPLHVSKTLKLRCRWQGCARYAEPSLSDAEIYDVVQVGRGNDAEHIVQHVLFTRGEYMGWTHASGGVGSGCPVHPVFPRAAVAVALSR